ncbi:MAG: type I-E CRISPR-associated protein Cas5/CasD [Ramlibacter sp.]|nr:type I-E CRISPR-associated protein Cas5/CasD [Ramlibacter sp.]
MDYLVFQLQAPLAAWGEPAVGEFRGSANHPGESALLGLLAAALGITRDEEARLASLQAGYMFAVGVQSSGTLLRDYHTAQVPGTSVLRGRQHATRADELALPRHELNTILSTRDYRQDAACLVAVQARAESPHALGQLADALRAPLFVLYLGRKACPPAAPLWPQVVPAESALRAFEAYRALIETQAAPHADRWNRAAVDLPLPVRSLSWSDGIEAGVAVQLSAPRKDRIIRRSRWQFGDRLEHTSMLAEEP